MSEALPKFPPLALGTYARWEKDMSAWLRYKGWYNIVAGVLPAPAEPKSGDPPSKERLDWLDVDSRAAVRSCAL